MVTICIKWVLATPPTCATLSHGGSVACPCPFVAHSIYYIELLGLVWLVSGVSALVGCCPLGVACLGGVLCGLSLCIWWLGSVPLEGLPFGGGADGQHLEGVAQSEGWKG